MFVYSLRYINIKQDCGQGGGLEEITHNFLYVYFLKKLYIFPPLKICLFVCFYHSTSLQHRIRTYLQMKKHKNQSQGGTVGYYSENKTQLFKM